MCHEVETRLLMFLRCCEDECYVCPIAAPPLRRFSIAKEACIQWHYIMLSWRVINSAFQSIEFPKVGGFRYTFEEI